MSQTPPTLRVLLRVSEPSGERQLYFEKETVNLGSGPGRDVILHSLDGNEVAAVIALSQNGPPRLFATGSAPVLVAGERVQQADLRDQQVIRIGGATITVRVGDAAQRPIEGEAPPPGWGLQVWTERALLRRYTLQRGALRFGPLADQNDIRLAQSGNGALFYARGQWRISSEERFWVNGQEQRGEVALEDDDSIYTGRTRLHLVRADPRPPNGLLAWKRGKLRCPRGPALVDASLRKSWPLPRALAQGLYTRDPILLTDEGEELYLSLRAPDLLVHGPTEEQRAPAHALLLAPLSLPLRPTLSRHGEEELLLRGLVLADGAEVEVTGTTLAEGFIERNSLREAAERRLTALRVAVIRVVGFQGPARGWLSRWLLG